MKIAILGTRGIPNNYGGFEQCAEYLSVGLVKKGHDVTIYSPSFHTYDDKEYKGVKIIRKNSPQRIFGNSASNFIYDFLCLNDAVKRDFDIILELGLITSSLSIIFIRKNNKLIITNIDGLEWKRSKWNVFIQYFTKKLEKYGVLFSDYLIADNEGIQDYILQEYNRESKLIAYGTEINNNFNLDYLKKYNLNEKKYILSIARLEPENNLEMMIDGYILSKLNIPYIIIGNHLTQYGDFLKDKYRGKGVVFLGGIFDRSCLDSLRFFAKYYLHGHSVGGTNPALLEAMAAKSFIYTHNNKFNKSVIGENTIYFSNSREVANLLMDDNNLLRREEYINNNLRKIKEVYCWDTIVNQYEEYMKEVLLDNL
tara:strand:+ start:1355 stop:2458 length:1104 start_codon:yes stop_codon:yes gene_type:complete